MKFLSTWLGVALCMAAGAMIYAFFHAANMKCPEPRIVEDPYRNYPRSQ